jgi:uncharacterized protein with ParB-like and HNH nuclease domain
MANLSEMRTDIQGLGYILKTNSLSVPKFQRSYKWEEKNVIDLTNDLAAALQEDEDESQVP